MDLRFQNDPEALRTYIFKSNEWFQGSFIHEASDFLEAGLIPPEVYANNILKSLFLPDDMTRYLLSCRLNSVS